MSENTKCDLCGVNQALYVCKICGRKVCNSCFDLSSWSCIECSEKSLVREEIGFKPVITVFKAFLIGFIIIAVGLILMVVAALLSGGTASIGFFFFPIPIIFWFGPKNAIFPSLSVFLIIFALFLFISILMLFTFK